MAKKLKPVHPGEILREEFMVPLRLSMNKMAMDLRVPVTRIADIVNERRGITADTALRFARYFKNTPTFWMNLQTRYELEIAEDEIAGKVERDVQPLEIVSAREDIGKKGWRRGWDLNPRSSFPDTRFRGELFQPLRHLSAAGASLA